MSGDGAPIGTGGAASAPAVALAAALRGARLVDLSLTLSEDLPCWWPGATRYRHVVDHWFEDAAESGPVQLRCRSGVAYRTSMVAIDEHTGTHFDAPAHFVPPPGSGLENAGPAGRLTADKVPLGQFVGPAAVVDVRSLLGTTSAGLSPRIEPELVTAWEQEHGRIAGGDVVLFRSDWDDHYLGGRAGRRYVEAPLVFSEDAGWPAPSPATMELLRDRGVRCVGTDAVSMGACDDGAPVHVVGLSAGMVFIEALGSLAELPARGALFLFLPLKIAEGSGAPGRALAVI